MVVAFLAFVIFGTLFVLLYPFLLPRMASLMVAGVMTVGLAAICYVPIGDQTLAEELERRGPQLLKEWKENRATEEGARIKREFNRKLLSRFAGVVPFIPLEGGTALGWQSGRVNGRPAWLDVRSGLVWGPALAQGLDGYDQASWTQAKAACGKEPPEGYWSLPTQTEFIKSQLSGMRQALPDFTAASSCILLSCLADVPLIAAMGGLTLGRFLC
jgi:hypothetical protein